MDSTWSLLGTAASQSALNGSTNSTWSLMETGLPQSPFNSSMNSTWSLIGTADHSSLFTLPTSNSQLLNSTWSSDSHAPVGSSFTSSWTASFSTVIVSGTASSIDLPPGIVTTPVVVTSNPTSVTTEESTPPTTSTLAPAPISPSVLVSPTLHTQTYTPPPETSTMTTLPPGFGAETIAGYDTNAFTWITTTRSDGSSTVLPIVGGLALWELPTILNVRFQLNLPGFHIPSFSFPCIRILFVNVGNCDKPPTNDENPQPSSSSSPPSQSSSSLATTTPSPPSTASSSSSSCTGTQTTSDCQVKCSLSVMSNGGTSTDCYTTVCSVTRAPCSITATTSTTLLSTTSAMRCPRGPSHNEISCASDDLECRILDDLASTSQSSTLSFINAVGQDRNKCTLSINLASTSVTWPQYPGAGTILIEDLVAAGVPTGTGGTSYLQGTRTSLVRWLSATTDVTNCAPSIVSLSAVAFQAAWDSSPTVDKWKCKPSLDHAFEKNWLSLFFGSIIDPNAQPLSSLPNTASAPIRQINCADLHNFFFGVHRTRNTMGELYNAMPGSETNFLGLAGMSKLLNNQAKGKVANLNDLTYLFNKALKPKKRVNPAGSFDDGYSKVQETLDILQDVWLGFEALNRPDLDNLITETYWQLWDVLKVLEDVASSESFGSDKFPIAERFEQHMTTMRMNINALSSGSVPQLFSALATDLQTLRQLATSPDQIALYNGAETKWNTFRSFPMNSGKWTWDSDLDMHTTHSPPAPPSPGSLTSACGELAGMPPCSAAPTTDISTTISTSTTASTPAETSSTSPACSSDSDCSSLVCSVGQYAACVVVGFGLHGYRTCQCTSSVDTNSPATPTQMEPAGPGSSGRCTAGSDCSNIACPSNEEIACVGFGLGEHAYSYCDCVTPPPPPPPSSSLPQSSLPPPSLSPPLPPSTPSTVEIPTLSTPEVVSQAPLTPPALSGCTIWINPSSISGHC